MTERSIVRAMCGVHLKDRQSARHLMLILDFHETIEQLAMASVFVGMLMSLEGH